MAKWNLTKCHNLTIVWYCETPQFSNVDFSWDVSLTLSSILYPNVFGYDIVFMHPSPILPFVWNNLVCVGFLLSQFEILHSLYFIIVRFNCMVRENNNWFSFLYLLTSVAHLVLAATTQYGVVGVSIINSCEGLTLLSMLLMSCHKTYWVRIRVEGVGFRHLNIDCCYLILLYSNDGLDYAIYFLLNPILSIQIVGIMHFSFLWVLPILSNGYHFNTRIVCAICFASRWWQLCSCFKKSTWFEV